MSIQDRLAAAGVTLPEVAAPAASYLPFMRVGDLVHTAGQLPVVGGVLEATGKLGAELTTEQGQALARRCAINILAIGNAVTEGDLDRLHVVKLTVFVASTPDFIEQHLVANGASNFMAEILGEQGRHARSAVGMPVLPLDAPVEIEAILRIA